MRDSGTLRLRSSHVVVCASPYRHGPAQTGSELRANISGGARSIGGRLMRIGASAIDRSATATAAAGR